MKSLRDSIRWGLGFAVIYIAYVLLLRLVRGSAPFDDAGISLTEVIAAYATAGVIGGLVFGLMRPLCERAAGSALTGFVVAVPVMYALGMAARPPGEWFTRLPFLALGAALLLGPAAGVIMWKQNRTLLSRRQ